MRCRYATIGYMMCDCGHSRFGTAQEAHPPAEGISAGAQAVAGRSGIPHRPVSVVHISHRERPTPPRRRRISADRQGDRFRSDQHNSIPASACKITLRCRSHQQNSSGTGHSSSWWTDMPYAFARRRSCDTFASERPFSRLYTCCAVIPSSTPTSRCESPWDLRAAARRRPTSRSASASRHARPIFPRPSLPWFAAMPCMMRLHAEFALSRICDMARGYNLHAMSAARRMAILSAAIQRASISAAITSTKSTSAAISRSYRIGYMTDAKS